MKIFIDTNANEIRVDDKDGRPLYSDEAFEVLSDIWVKVGWNQKYSYGFSWMGIPIIQLPEDMVRVQEVIHRVQPDVIIETGVAHGGSLIFYSSLLESLGKGRVIGIDVEIRTPNRARLEAHPLAHRITLVEGSSIDPAVVGTVANGIDADETVLVLLDSDHSYAHVHAELEAYAPLVTKGSYIVATDGLMRDIADVPRGQAEWRTNNPANAAEDFVRERPEFVLEQPAWPFSETTLTRNVTHWPSAWLRRRS